MFMQQIMNTPVSWCDQTQNTQAGLAKKTESLHYFPY